MAEKEFSQLSISNKRGVKSAKKKFVPFLIVVGILSISAGFIATYLADSQTTPEESEASAGGITVCGSGTAGQDGL